MHVAASADIQAFLHDIKLLEQGSAGLMDSLLMTRQHTLPSLTKEYNAAIEGMLLQVGMHLPFSLETSMGSCNGACVLVEGQGNTRFVCDLFLDKHICLKSGMQMYRTVSYVEPMSRKVISFQSKVATIAEILPKN